MTRRLLLTTLWATFLAVLGSKVEAGMISSTHLPSGLSRESDSPATYSIDRGNLWLTILSNSGTLTDAAFPVSNSMSGAAPCDQHSNGSSPSAIVSDTIEEASLLVDILHGRPPLVTSQEFVSRLFRPPRCA